MTAEKTEQVRAALELVLTDFQHPGPVDLRLEVGADRGDDLVWVRARGTGTGFWVDQAADGPKLLVEVADFLQDQVFDQLEQTWGQARPPCPGHAHPAYPTYLDGQAWWLCPASRERLDLIGLLREEE